MICYGGNLENLRIADEAAGVHCGPWRHGGLAARGARTAPGDAGDRMARRDNSRSETRLRRRISPWLGGYWLCRGTHSKDFLLGDGQRIWGIFRLTHCREKLLRGLGA